MSRYLVRRWLVGVVGLSLTFITAGLQAQTKAESENDETAKEQVARLQDELAAKNNQLEELRAVVQELKAERDQDANSAAEQEAKRQKESVAKDKQLSQMRAAIASMQEQLQPIRAKQQYEEDLKRLQPNAQFIQHRFGPAEARIYAELDKPTVLEFIETPLSDVVEYLKDYHKMEIQIDRRALDDAGVGTDTPITRNLRGISLRSALGILLRDLDLTWIVDNEVLLITTNEEARKQLETRTYDVRALLTDQQRSSELAEVVRQILHASHQKGQDIQKPASPPAGVVTAYRDLLIVRTNPHGHREVEDLLEQLAQGSKPGGKKTADITSPDVDVEVRKRP